MMNTLVIVVTGTNRGVGKGIVQLLARQQLEQPLTIYATSRSGADTGIQASSTNVIKYGKLDITDQTSIQSFLQSVLKEHSAIDVLINNAAVSNDYRETPEYAEETIRNNYGGTKNMCELFLPNMSRKPWSRIVNVVSGYNQLSKYGLEIQEKFRAVKTISDIDALGESYLGAAKQGQDAQKAGGWGSGARSYKVSKALILAMTMLLAKQNPEIMINCCCPGWVDTAMGHQAKGTPPKTPEEGARIPVRLAVGDLGVNGDEDGGLGKESERISGKFFENDSIISTEWGKSKLWLET
ncbi:NAD(P)-binding protein [Lentithecium fluviatile CBS 122367]|uniref:NAD(P)-binding protein n=1 Tax=Lentithecium fluviatile CBS 122367 TaxID=1168545 RepID=A0A6G1J6M6_9PLEO|nr:NAD(P)-binding protein [Lentithecium fluviatile CBS 122367]